MPSAAAFAPLVTRERLVVAGLLVFTLVVRSGVLWALRGNLEQDPDAYREIAENVLAHGVYGLGKDGKPTPTAYRPPLYPIVLSNLPAADGKHVSLVKVAALHVLLGVTTVWLTYLTARKCLSSGPTLRVGHELAQPPPSTNAPNRPIPRLFRFLAHTECGPTLAALLVACDPILLNQQTLVMTETLATFLTILALWCLARFHEHRYWWNAGLAGGAIGLAALCRPTFLPWLGLVAAGMLISDFGFQISDWKTRLGRKLANVAALAVAAAAVMSPWAIRNQQMFGKPILTTTHGGYTLALGNNESFYKWLKASPNDQPWKSAEFDSDLQNAMIPFSLDMSPSSIYFPLEEVDQDFFAYNRARDSIRNNPGMFVTACLYRIGQLWSSLPHKLTADESTGRRLLRYATAAWYCGVYVLVAVGVWRLRWKLLRQPWVWGVLLCLTFTAVHTFYWCNLRMRAPLMPFVALVAGAALVSNKPEARAKERGDNSQ